VPALITWWKLDVAELAPGAHSDAVLAIGSDLERRLGESHRHYHTTRHLVEMFWALEDLEGAGVVSSRETAVGRIAGWFHDAVYDPTTPGDSEIHSAELAVRDLTALGFAEDDVETVRDLVLATQTHELARDGLAAAFHDADLWILGSPPERYAEYVAQVRLEYAAVPDEVFRSARAAILRPFLDRESIYATAHATESWEEAARLNLATELASLVSSRPR
jgi:predicted metal-dependent HD superfamily phosphohydrolase